MYNNKDITFTIDTDDTLYFDFDNQIHDYLTAINKPSINGHVLIGDMTLEDVGIKMAIASNTQLGQVIIKKNGGIFVDEKGYIWIEGYEKKEEIASDGSGNTITTTTLGGGLTVTTVTGPGGDTIWTEIGGGDGPGIVVGGEKTETTTTTTDNPDGSKTTTTTTTSSGPSGNKKKETTTTTGIPTPEGGTGTTTTVITEGPGGSKKETTTTTSNPTPDGGNKETTTVTVLDGPSSTVGTGTMTGTTTTTTTTTDGGGTTTVVTDPPEDETETDGVPWAKPKDIDNLYSDIFGNLGWDFGW